MCCRLFFCRLFVVCLFVVESKLRTQEAPMTKNNDFNERTGLVRVDICAMWDTFHRVLDYLFNINRRRASNEWAPIAHARTYQTFINKAAGDVMVVHTRDT